MNVSLFLNTTTDQPLNVTDGLVASDDHQLPPLHCTRGSLTSSYGWMVQGILASVAFTCLIVKRFCEPKGERRTWRVWLCDTSKQILGALVIHFINILVAELFGGIDPCTQYFISFLLDSTIGLLVIYIGLKVTQFFAVRRGCEFLVFGFYGHPKPRLRFWWHQTLVYIAIAIMAKIFVTLLLQLHFWAEVQNFLLLPIPNPQVEVTVVVLIIPFVINVIMFWVTDNLLTMDRSGQSANTTSTKNVSSKLSFLTKMPFRLPFLSYWRRGRDGDDAGLIEVSMEQNPFATRT